MIDVNKLKIGTKIIDRHYSFHKTKSNRYGIGKIVKMTKAKNFIFIKFSKVKEPIKYDKEHIEHFTSVYKIGMEKYPNGFVPEFHSAKKLRESIKNFKNRR